MAYRGYTTEEVADRSPPQTNRSGYLAMQCNQRRMVGVNIVGPLFCILIRAIPDIGEETEFQMIVGVDQTRKQQKP